MKKQTGLSIRQLSHKTNIPKYYKANYEKAILGNSRKEAVKAKCLDCMNWDKKEVAICEIETCPLWPYRPYIKPSSNTVRKIKSTPVTA
jgi:hypothetical protein